MNEPQQTLSLVPVTTRGAIAFNAQIAGTYTGGVWIPGPDTDAVHEIPFVNDMPGYNEQRKRNVSLRIVHEFDNMTFESISSYSTIKDDYTAKGLPYADFSNPDNNYGLHDADTRDLLVPDLWADAFGDLTQRWRDQNEAFIQEFRLTSNDESARLRWQVGVYYQNGEKKRTNINGIYTGAPAIDNWMPNGPDDKPFGELRYHRVPGEELFTLCQYPVRHLRKLYPLPCGSLGKRGA